MGLTKEEVVLFLRRHRAAPYGAEGLKENFCLCVYFLEFRPALSRGDLRDARRCRGCETRVSRQHETRHWALKRPKTGHQGQKSAQLGGIKAKKGPFWGV